MTPHPLIIVRGGKEPSTPVNFLQIQEPWSKIQVRGLDRRSDGIDSVWSVGLRRRMRRNGNAAYQRRSGRVCRIFLELEVSFLSQSRFGIGSRPFVQFSAKRFLLVYGGRCYR